MASDDTTQERNEPASPKKKQDARKKGKVASSREIPSVFVLLAGLGSLLAAGGWMGSRLVTLTGFHMAHIADIPATPMEIYNLMIGALGNVALIVVPVAFSVMVAGVAGNVLQFGLLFKEEWMVPKLEKLNPLKGLKRLFSLNSIMELLKCLLKVGVVGTTAYLVLRGRLGGISAMMDMPFGEMLAFIRRVSLEMGFFTALVLICLAVADYTYQKWQYEKSLRMSKEEVKEEFKQREGDPKVRARIRKIQMEMSRKRMMDDVAGADVVIVNPTSLAIALRYHGATMAAPKVVAKGAGYIAAKIRDRAYENGVPVVENKPLAQALFKAVDVGDVIPLELYQAVAEVLAYVYRLHGKTA